MRWILVLAATVAFAQTVELPRTVRQGSALRVRGSAGAVSARMREKAIRLFPQPDGGTFGLLPIPIAQKPGEYTVELLDGAGAVVASAPVTVVDARFRKQNVSMEERRRAETFARRD